MKKNILTIKTVMSLMILTTGCSTLDKSMFTGAVIGAGAAGSLGSLATSHRRSHDQAKTVILTSALGGLIGMGIASTIYKQNKEEREKRFSTYDKIMNDPMKKNMPDLTRPRIETRWVKGQIVDDKYIEGHFEYIIVEPTHWER